MKTRSYGASGFEMGSLGFEPRISRAPGVNLRPSSTTTPLYFQDSLGCKNQYKANENKCSGLKYNSVECIAL